MQRARSNGGRCARSPGAADARRCPHHPLRAGGSAARVTPRQPQANDWRVGRAGSIRKKSSGPASGVAGDRGGELADAQRPERSAVSEAPGCSPSALVHATHEGKGRAIPGHGNGALAQRHARDQRPKSRPGSCFCGCGDARAGNGVLRCGAGINSRTAGDARTKRTMSFDRRRSSGWSDSPSARAM